MEEVWGGDEGPLLVGVGHPDLDIPVPAPCGIKGRALGLQISSWWDESLGNDWLANNLYGDFILDSLIAKMWGLEKGRGCLRCSEFSMEGGI